MSKAALRTYVQVLNAQLAGTDVHATSVTIGGIIGSEPKFEPDTLARAYLDLHRQPGPPWQHELLID